MVRTDRGGKLVTLATLVLVVAALACSSKEDDAFSRLEPVLVAPKDGETFRKFPRTIALEWRKVPEAVRYMVEIELQNPLNGVWLPTPVAMNRQFLTNERLFIEFPGDQPGRWRVVAYNSGGTLSRTSDWSHFEFLLP